MESTLAESAASFARTTRGSGSIRIGRGTQVLATVVLSPGGSDTGFVVAAAGGEATWDSAFDSQPLTAALLARASVVTAAKRTRSSLMGMESIMCCVTFVETA